MSDSISFTSTPCDGCGVKRRRPKGTICRECLDLMNDGRKLRMSIEVKAKEEYQVFSIPERNRAYTLEYIREDRGDDHKCSPVREALIDLTEVVSEPATSDVRPTPLMRKGDNYAFTDRPIITSIKIAECMRALQKEIKLLADRAYDDGVSYGSNALRKLASGESSVDDFNRVTTRAK